MSWCDKLSSTPAVGIRLTPSYVEAGHLLNNFQPMLNKLYEGEKPTFTIEFVDSGEVKINTEAGFLYQMGPTSASVTFNHRIRAQPTSAGLPVIELLSSPAPYSNLLDQVIEKLVEFVGFIPQDHQRSMWRVGVVSLTNVDFDDAPPGIQELFKKIGDQFGREIEELNGAFAVRLDESDEFYERCIHNLNRPLDRKRLTTISLDWQRAFHTPRGVSRSRLEDMLQDARSAAMAYFEKVAEGGLDDRQS